MLTLCTYPHIAAKWRLLLEWSSVESQWARPKDYDPVLFLSPNKSRPLSVCGQALVPASCSADGWALGCLMDSLHSARTGPMASWIDWPKGAVGGKHFLCVLMDTPTEALWRLVAGWWLLLLLSLTLSQPSSFAFPLPVNQRRVKWDEPGFPSRQTLAATLTLHQNLDNTLF